MEANSVAADALEERNTSDMPYELKAELNALYVNSEPIVRCRDCKHMHTVRNWLGLDVDECWLHADPESGALGKEPTEPDGFCAWGEQKAEQR